MPPKQKALDKQTLNNIEKEKKDKEKQEKEEESKWSVGAKDGSKQKEIEEKEEQKRKKAAEMAALLAADEADTSQIIVKKTTKKKGKDDFDMLNAALANQPKSKAQKEAEAKKKVDEERKTKEAEIHRLKEEKKKVEEDQIKKMAAKGIVMNHTDELMIPINNKLEEDDFEGASGLDAAIGVLKVGNGKSDDHPERRQKALYNAFYEYNLPILKEEHPGLKLSQYKDRIFDMWKHSPENPHNQIKMKSNNQSSEN